MDEKTNRAVQITFLALSPRSRGGEICFPRYENVVFLEETHFWVVSGCPNGKEIVWLIRVNCVRGGGRDVFTFLWIVFALIYLG